jgi:hypothetical protein
MAISSFGNKEATRATEKRLRRVAETPAKLVMSTDFPAAPRLNEPLPAYFESACGGSTPPGAIAAISPVEPISEKRSVSVKFINRPGRNEGGNVEVGRDQSDGRPPSLASAEYVGFYDPFSTLQGWIGCANKLAHRERNDFCRCGQVRDAARGPTSRRAAQLTRVRGIGSEEPPFELEKRIPTLRRIAQKRTTSSQAQACAPRRYQTLARGWWTEPGAAGIVDGGMFLARV